MCRSCARIRLAALVPPPRVHLTRFHGVFAAHAALIAAITPGGRGAVARKRAVAPESPTPKAFRMNWARRLTRVFGIEIEQCVRCGGRLKVIASIEEPPIRRRDLLAALTQSALRATAASAVGPFKKCLSASAWWTTWVGLLLNGLVAASSTRATAQSINCTNLCRGALATSRRLRPLQIRRFMNTIGRSVALRIRRIR